MHGAWICILHTTARREGWSRSKGRGDILVSEEEKRCGGNMDGLKPKQQVVGNKAFSTAS
jgi:hypothetical protein